MPPRHVGVGNPSRIDAHSPPRELPNEAPELPERAREPPPRTVSDKGASREARGAFDP